ncbi:hypothetical protein SLEP1_g9270 [Rubroshorea leprosula]|uniref:Uncharacterized protein n=1 Tax=Rubroshorea leprosula TaxID=152421 RepID=A0AAV5IEA5_9ROSI|nr:hypothetical protein SLEP1_g9270 [Rubroshorea leprosula]
MQIPHSSANAAGEQTSVAPLIRQLRPSNLNLDVLGDSLQLPPLLRQ